MNKNMLIMAAAALLIAVALFVFYNDGDTNNDDTLGTDEQKGLTLLKVAQETCLSGMSEDASVDINLETDFLTSFKAGSGVHKEKARGAVNYVNEQVRSIVDKDVRDCLQKHMPQIQACLLGDCNSASLPRSIDFQFTYKPVRDIPYLMQDLVSFGLENRTDNRVLFKQPGKGYFVDSIPLFAENKKRNAAIFGVVRESYVPDFNENTRFCLRRSSQTPKDGSYTLYHCKQGEGCQHESTTPKWFEFCEAVASGRNDFLFPLIRTAHAQAGSEDWAIPSLKVLQEREDLFGIGYTHFKVEAAEAMNKDYDGYFYDITVNGRKANINGLQGSVRARSHDFSQPISIEFGLQNLNFSGVNDGCDEISLTLNFVKDGESVGEPVTLRRSYVALRDARVKDISSGGIQYRWSGKYQRAPKMYDTEVFISSILIAKNLDLEGNKAAIEKAKQNISAMKQDFDSLGLVFEGRPLVAVIRPPLTQISYGLAIGMVEETQQIRFTYESSTAKRLKAFLLEQRARGGKYKSTIAHDTFLYSIRGDESYMASPPVCADDR
jgi:hypothetical protein